MGFIRRRRSIKILPGVRVNLNSKSTSVTVGGKYSRTTISSTGKRTHSTRIPGTNLTYVSTSNSAKGSSAKKDSATNYSAPVKKRSAGLYKFCGVLITIIGVLAILLGLISISVGGGVLMGLGGFCLIPGFVWLRAAKKIKKENSLADLPEDDSEEK